MRPCTFLALQVDMFDQMIEDEKRIRLGEAGWKERYYSEKMGATPATFEKIRKDLVHYYVQGLVRDLTAQLAFVCERSSSQNMPGKISNDPYQAFAFHTLFSFSIHFY